MPERFSADTLRTEAEKEATVDRPGGKQIALQRFDVVMRRETRRISARLLSRAAVCRDLVRRGSVSDRIRSLIINSGIGRPIAADATKTALLSLAAP